MVSERLQIFGETLVDVAERWPEQHGSTTDDGLDLLKGGVHLLADGLRAEGRKMGMIPTMAAHAMSVSDHPFEDFRKSLHLLTQTKEGGSSVVSLKDIQNPNRKNIVRSIIEGKGNVFFGMARCRQLSRPLFFGIVKTLIHTITNFRQTSNSRKGSAEPEPRLSLPMGIIAIAWGVIAQGASRRGDDGAKTQWGS